MKSSLVLVLLVSMQLNAQESPFGNVKFHPHKIYIIARGTKSKQGFISKTFNNADTNITHIGVGYYDPLSKDLRIYNITTEKRKRNALLIETLPEFMSPKDIFYLGVWEYNINAKKFTRLAAALTAYDKRTVTFDYDFDLQNADSLLYCSEFCWKILTGIDKNAFRFSPVQKQVPNSFYKSMLGTDVLNFIPVDFFLSVPGFKKMKEWIIK